VYKVLSIMQKPADMSLEDWRRWATEEHPKLARQIPGMVKYVVNVTATDDPNAEFHLVNEMYFADEESFKAGFGSEAGKAAGADAAGAAAKRVRLVVEQHDLI
jgi:uncharacterized protein (TIGR02118 family)